MKIAVIQPNFFPFKAYYDLAQRVDKLIFLDDTFYNNKHWVNKTILKLNSSNYYFRIPVDHVDGSSVLVKDIKAKDNKWKKKFLKFVKVQYKNSINFNSVFPTIEEIVNLPTDSVAHIAAYSVFRFSSLLGFKTEFSLSSIKYGNIKRSMSEKILQICKKEKAKTYYTLMKNRGTFDERKFLSSGIRVSFFTSYSEKYSIIDDLMTNHSYTNLF
tara:strand:- start:32535 stop:33176 length:642 start_codon:yes stop_codon:yes gene_type:complete